MPTVQLPGGATAEIVDEEGLTGYAEQVVLEIIGAVDDMNNPSFGRVGAAFLRSQVELLPHVITSWSYPQKITLDAVMRLPRSVRRALVTETEHLHGAIMKSVNGADGAPDPKSPDS